MVKINTFARKFRKPYFGERSWLTYLLFPFLGLLCPVPGVWGVAGMPGVWGVQGVWGPGPPSPILFTASDIWDKGPSSRGYCPDTIPTKIYFLISPLFFWDRKRNWFRKVWIKTKFHAFDVFNRGGNILADGEENELSLCLKFKYFLILISLQSDVVAKI